MMVNIIKFTRDRSLNQPPGEISYLVAHINKQQFSLERAADKQASTEFRVGRWICN